MFYLIQGRASKTYDLIELIHGNAFKAYGASKDTIKEVLDFSEPLEFIFKDKTIEDYLKRIQFVILYKFSSIQEFENDYPELLL